MRIRTHARVRCIVENFRRMEKDRKFCMLTALAHPGLLFQETQNTCVAFEEIKSSYHNPDTTWFTIHPYYGNLTLIPYQQPRNSCAKYSPVSQARAGARFRSTMLISSCGRLRPVTRSRAPSRSPNAGLQAPGTADWLACRFASTIQTKIIWGLYQDSLDSDIY